MTKFRYLLFKKFIIVSKYEISNFWQYFLKFYVQNTVLGLIFSIFNTIFLIKTVLSTGAEEEVWWHCRRVRRYAPDNSQAHAGWRKKWQKSWKSHQKSMKFRSKPSKSHRFRWFFQKFDKNFIDFVNFQILIWRKFFRKSNHEIWVIFVRSHQNRTSFVLIVKIILSIW